MFVDREKELKTLEERYRNKNAEFVIIYGRRRVGKTELIKKFIHNKPAIYYMADNRSINEQLEILSKIIGEFFNDEILINQPLQSFELILKYLINKSTEKKLILVIDEFPFLVEADSSIPSLLQKYWDLHLKDKNIFIILCGSSMSYMEKEVLSYKSPIYGRRTGQLEITPFDFFNAKKMLGNISNEKAIQFYGVFGGIPAYLELVDSNKSIFANIEEQILPSDRFLYNEVNFLLMQELRNPRYYFSILRAISMGNTKLNDIVQFTGLERNIVGKYIDNLMQLKIVQRTVPATEDYNKSRKGIYEIVDNYFRFWFRYIYPNLSYIEIGKYDYVMNIVKNDFSNFLSKVYERVCLKYLIENFDLIPFPFQKIGAYWDRENEIDIIAFDDKGNCFLAECKYSNKKVGVNILEELKAKSYLFAGEFKQFYYGLFSKSGFTNDLIQLSKQSNVVLVDIDFNPKKFKHK